VNNGVSNWNIYFGGWDGTSSGNDEISIVNTQDNFYTFKPHYVMISHGSYDHVNNENVIKLDNTSWCMLYTTFPNDGTNKPAYATSDNGARWTPRSGNTDFLITMNGYPSWGSADVNGGNVIYYEDGVFHLYFIDFKNPTGGVLHATSLNFINYSYQGVVLNQLNRIVNDVKRINGYYLMGSHFNTDKVWISISQSLSSFPDSRELFKTMGEYDRYITSLGFVADDSRLYGALYGASKVPTLDQNSIYAIWLQKQVLFKNSEIVWGLGNASRAYGPDNMIMITNANQATGKFYLYDTDGTTLLYESPVITVREGDIWEYTYKASGCQG